MPSFRRPAHILAALALSLAAHATAARPAAAQEKTTNATPNTCVLEYQRADNMWAAYGNPGGSILGVESITLQAGQTKGFITDWKYEKTKNDGSNYYGSHLRIATNKGQRPLTLLVRTLDPSRLINIIRTGTDTYRVPLSPGASAQFKADLMEVACPAS